MGAIIPTAPEVLREAVIVLAGVVIAALVLRAFPPLRVWVKESGL